MHKCNGQCASIVHLRPSKDDVGNADVYLTSNNLDEVEENVERLGKQYKMNAESMEIIMLHHRQKCYGVGVDTQTCTSTLNLRTSEAGMEDVDVQFTTSNLEEVDEKIDSLGKQYQMDSAGKEMVALYHKQKCYRVGVEAQTCSVKNYSFKDSRVVNTHNIGTVGLINGTTRSTVPALFKEFLLTRSPIDECASTFMPAANAVEKLEDEVGWNAEASTFTNPSVLDSLVQQGIGDATVNSDTPPISLVNLGNRPAYELMDIVVPSIRDLEFLEAWKPFIEKFNIIVIQDGDPTKQMKIPSWANYELYNRKDIERALGLRSWIISTRDASIRNFGFLVSDKDFVYTLDDDCLPARDNEGHLVDAITQHLVNLLTPSTPYFFNTVYDPYRPGVDFVRGYPYSLRDGVTTAVSHGLWMNAYDYDAPTQLLKVAERNTRYHDMTQTIPNKVFYPMCSMNVAFNRKLIGPAFMQGLMGDGQPWARYDDMFAGWASKLIGDHLGVGTKSGAPYVYHNKSSNPFTNLKKEYKGLFWQEMLIEFFHGITLSSTSNTASKAYKELAEMVSEQLTPINPYFGRLANAMGLWLEVWEDRFGGSDGAVDCQVFDRSFESSQHKCIPKWLPISSRSSMGPKHNDTTCAIFTIVYNEAVFLPVWLRYYLQHAHADDMWILDHNTADGSTSPELLHGVNYKKLYGETSWMPHHFMNRQVELHIQRLLRAGYKCVLFTEVDEMIVADTKQYPLGLKQYMKSFAEDPTKKHVRVTGYEVGHVSQGEKVEPALDWNQPILMQREYMMLNHLFSKALLSKLPIRYHPGFHHAWTASSTLGDPMPMDRTLVMLHLHSVDKTYCVQREENKYNNAKIRGRKEESRLGINTLMNKPFDPSQQCCLALLGEEDLDTPPCMSGNEFTRVNRDNVPLMRIPSGWKAF